MRELEPESSSDSDSSEEMSEKPEKKSFGEMGKMSEGQVKKYIERWMNKWVGPPA